MRIFILCGEVSGDQLGGFLARHLNASRTDMVLGGWGGHHMAAGGVQLYRKIEDLGFMGFWEVAGRMWLIRRLLSECRKDILSFKPDKVVFIDFGGFNMKMASWCSRRGMPTVYFNPPKLWASRAGRLKSIQKHIDLVVSTLPFESEWFKSRGFTRVVYFGHPLVEKIDQWMGQRVGKPNNSDDPRPLVALLPGSRPQEIRRILPVLLQFAAVSPQYRFEISCAPGMSRKALCDLIDSGDHLTVPTTEATFDLMQRAEMAVIASGTASLEAALFDLPHFVVYKLHPLNFAVAKRLIKVVHISLVNLIMNRSVVSELIQDQLSVNNLARELKKLQAPGIKEQMRANFNNIRQLLGKNYTGQNIARAIIELK